MEGTVTGKAGCEAEETSEGSTRFRKDEKGPRWKAGWRRWCLWLRSRKESVWPKLRSEERLTERGLQAAGRLEPGRQGTEGRAPRVCAPQERLGCGGDRARPPGGNGESRRAAAPSPQRERQRGFREGRLLGSRAPGGVRGSVCRESSASHTPRGPADRRGPAWSRCLCGAHTSGEKPHVT